MSRFTLPACAALACAALASGARLMPRRPRKTCSTRSPSRASAPAGRSPSPRSKDAARKSKGRPARSRSSTPTPTSARRPRSTIKDALDYTPGVFAQPKWGEDTRLSIRGSGLSRNFHLRGVQLYHGRHPDQHRGRLRRLPGDRPAAYPLDRGLQGRQRAALRRQRARRRDQLRDADRPRPTPASRRAGVDVGSFGFRRLQASSGGVDGAARLFRHRHLAAAPTASAIIPSGQSERCSANIGYQISENVETRFYLNANTIRQRIPGAVTRDVALTDPETAAAINVANDWQRNIDSGRVANKTTMRLDETTTVEVGAFGVDRHLMHPIFQWLDYNTLEYGGFARVTDERMIGGFRNRFIAGVNLHNGDTDADQYVSAAARRAQDSRRPQDLPQVSAYAENSFYVLPSVGSWPARNSCTPARADDVCWSARADRRRLGTTELQSLEPEGRRAVGHRRRASRSSPTSRAAPRRRASASTARGHRHKGADRDDFELGTRGRRPDVTWDSRSIAPRSGTNCCAVPRRSATATSPTRTARSTRASRRLRRSGPQIDLRAGLTAAGSTSCGSTSPIRSTTSVRS